MKIKKVIVGLVAAIVLLGGSFIGGSIWSNSLDASTPKITSDLISERLVGVSELASVKYFYTNMGKFEERNNFYGWEVPLTKKTFIVSYDGEISAGIDMAELKVDVANNRVTVTLPPAKILSHTIIDDSLEVFDESSNIFNPIKITDYTGFSKAEKTKIEEKALANGLLTDASDKARDAVKNLLEATNSTKNPYTIEIK